MSCIQLIAVQDATVATAARAFFTKVLAAIGARPDDHYTETLGPALYQALALPALSPTVLPGAL